MGTTPVNTYLIISEFFQVLSQLISDFVVQNSSSSRVVLISTTILPVFTRTFVDVAPGPFSEASCDLFQSTDCIGFIVADQIIGGFGSIIV